MIRSEKIRFLLFITACSVAGIIVGGVSASIENKYCNTTTNTTLECIKKDPTSNVIYGMSNGLFAGIGAAVAIRLGYWIRGRK